MKLPILHFTRLDLLKFLVLLAVAALLTVWLIYTPAGLLGKADALGYAVCHRIRVRSFLLGDRQLPMCARCSGMYLGALLGLIYQLRAGKRGGLPPLKIMLVFGLFLAAFGIDGVNSYLHFFPQAPSLYQPQNTLRLITGTFLGVGMGAVLFPVFNQSLWTDWVGQPILNSYKQIAVLIILSLIVDVLVLSGNPLILYPLALLSAFSVLLLLTMIYTIIWLLITKRENLFTTPRQAWFAITAGFGTALLQIAVLDLLRFLLTNTWDGFFFS
jgi:uncharacterized membrane protein